MTLQISRISTSERTLNIEGPAEDVAVVEKLVIFFKGILIKQHDFLFNRKKSEKFLCIIEEVWKQVNSNYPSIFYIYCGSATLALLTHSIEERYVLFLAKALVKNDGNIITSTSGSSLFIKDTDSGKDCFNTIFAAASNLGILDRD